MSIIEFIKLCLLGIVQGLTEPLPISSSAHMILLNSLLKTSNNDLSVEILFNFASSLAILYFFRKKVIALVKSIITNKKDQKYPNLSRSYFFKLIIASIPIAITGILLKDLINNLFLSNLTIALSLLITSLMLFICMKMLNKKKIFTDEITVVDSIHIGLLQVIALVPGISRSGITLFGGLLRNTKIKDILDFSFFLYLIASFGSFFLSIIDNDFTQVFTLNNIFFYLVAFVITFFVTLASISIFYKIINKKTISYFSIYALLLGLFFLFVEILKLLPMQ